MLETAGSTLPEAQIVFGTKDRQLQETDLLERRLY